MEQFKKIGVRLYKTRLSQERFVLLIFKYTHLPIVEDVTKWYPDMEEIKKRILFWAATNVQGGPELAPAGTQQSFIIRNLSPGTYYFAIKSYDDENNQSELSNVVSVGVE